MTDRMELLRRLPVLDSRRSVLRPFAVQAREPGNGALVDARGRRHRYLRLSVTDRCDFACTYCMPPGGEEEHGRRSELLSFEECVRLVRVLANAGIRRVRLTGGEPLVRKDIVSLVRMLKSTTPIDALVMTTNGNRLSELAAPLRDAGLDGVNVSIDSLDPACFARITRGGDVRKVQAGLRAGRETGLALKTNTVLLPDHNASALRAIVEYAWSMKATPRFIERMPLGQHHEGAFLSVADARRFLAPIISDKEVTAMGVLGPARYVSSRDGKRRVGFISALSQGFCEDCNRLRITAVGEVRACLASRSALSLRDLMRAGAEDVEVLSAVRDALAHKARGHAFLDRDAREHLEVGMSLIGG